MAMFSILHFFFFSVVLMENLAPVHSQCLMHQKTLLLKLKNELIFNSSYSLKLVRWNQTDDHDCCDWDGVECDGAGRVIGLQLDNETISGGIFEVSSSLFHLRYLRKLNLAHNDFNGVRIPSGIHCLKYLRHLNLSDAGFDGQVPVELSLLRRLVSLDISSPYRGDVQSLKLENPNLKMIIQNLTRIREVYLDGVDVSAGGSKWCQVISSSLPQLRILSLRWCNLSGPLHPSLLQLHSLSVLQLDRNNFSTTIPDFFANFSSLTTLSLSFCYLRGPLPEMILQVPTLQELDLSLNDLNGTIPQFPLGRGFRYIDLSYCSFDGPIPSTLGNLTDLTHLDLSHNSLTGSLFDSHFEGLSNLVYLNLYFNSLSGSIPRSLFGLRSLQELQLSNNQFSGQINEFPILNFSNLVYLDLTENSFSGSIPHSLFGLPSLKELRLSNNQFRHLTEFPIANISNIVYLDLVSNSLSGSIPRSLFALPSLQELRLSNNQFSGQINGFPIVNMSSSNVVYLDLEHNSLSGSIPSLLFGLPSVQEIRLSNNQFTGKVMEFPIVNNISNLVHLDLSSNRLEGPIPDSFFQLQRLESLDLSYNLFNGTFQLGQIQRLPNLATVSLSFNNLSVDASNTSSELPLQLHELGLASCNLYDFPYLMKQSSLTVLDLSNNWIAGDIPSWIWEIGYGTLTYLNLSCNFLVDLQKPYHFPSYLFILDLHSNQLRGELPQLPPAAGIVDYSNNSFDKPIPPTIFENVTSPISLLSFANNRLSGAIPTPLSNPVYVQVLDLSFNKLSNNIPPHLLEKIVYLEVLNLRGNNINGVIPDQFSASCNLRTLDLSDNNLGGKIPKSLANCKFLAVMNVGYNNFDDSFPCMLSSSLQALVLRSNRFHGDLRCGKSWPNLQIVDLSSNNFSGSLHPLNFSSWRGMILQSHAHLRPNHSGSDFLSPTDFYHDEVTITIKGIVLKLVKIWPDFTSIDLSCNNFQGDIPDAIGNLSSLYLLNLSHNALTGTIPQSLGALTELESLDISVNQLRGTIPEELARLTFLSFLNLSNNKLVGVIPNGRQLQTFSANSFQGNPGLCGFPLNTSCINTDGNDLPAPEHENVQSKREIEWDYVSAALGYVVGLGSIGWLLLFCRSFREKYFDKVDEVLEKVIDGRNRKRRRARRVVRNQVRRQ